MEEDVMGQIEMILRGVIANEGAPQAYSAWNHPLV
jgi:hypothetical protein